MNGSDEEWLELVVLGPPSMPMGPLECTDVTASTCKLHWLPPEDDGGVPIQGCVSIDASLYTSRRQQRRYLSPDQISTSKIAFSLFQLKCRLHLTPPPQH